MSNTLERWFDNKRLSPFREFPTIEETFDKLMNEMLAMRKKESGPSFSFAPSCEIIEDENNYAMKFDMPGISKDQVKVEVDKNQLTVHAERKEEKSSQGKKKYLSEVYYGSYTRTFTLPGPVDEKKVDAKFENGVLTVTVPKTESLKVKQIPVQ